MATFATPGISTSAGSEEKRPSRTSLIFSRLYDRSWCDRRLVSSGKSSW